MNRFYGAPDAMERGKIFNSIVNRKIQNCRNDRKMQHK